MSTFVEIITNIKDGKINEFEKIEVRMKLTLNKYTRLMYKEEKEDVYSELRLALWEAIVNIEYYDDEKKVLAFLYTAIKNKFLELYRSSRKKSDNECSVEDDILLNIVSKEESDIDKIVFYEDMKKFLKNYSGLKKQTYKCMIMEDMSDTEISMKMNVSRQYVNRLRKQLKRDLFAYVNSK